MTPRRGKAKGAGLNFRASPDLSVTRVFTGCHWLGGGGGCGMGESLLTQPHCISTRGARGEARTQLPGKHLPAVFPGSVASAAQAEGTGSCRGDWMDIKVPG